MKIKFIGATESVTGSKHLLITESGKQILLDCGLYQGMGKETDPLNRQLGIDPSNIDAVILSHGHIDHSGNLPNLVKQGFNGKIYCTPATFDVCSILLLDSGHIHESDVRFINKRRKEKGKELLKPLYTVKDAERCIKRFKVIPYDTDFQLNDEVSFYFSENGHIIGSAAININAKENGKFTRLAYTGDIGRYTDPLLKPPAVFQQADYIICESTYGDRLHDEAEKADVILAELIQKTCVEQKGKLIIAAFSLGRTQEILYVLDQLKNKNLLPDLNVYVDSPLSSKATAIVKSHPESFNQQLKDYAKNDPEPFGFVNLRYVENADESKKINESKDPCIVISASGMCDAGRIKHHLRHTISDEKNTLLLTGYCAPQTLGAKLLSGQKQVSIFGDLFEVKAHIASIRSLSAHADYKEMIRYLSCQDKKQIKCIYLVHGEAAAKMAFKAELLSEGYNDVQIAEKGEIVALSSHRN